MDRGSWHCTGGSDRDHPQEKEMQKDKMLFWGCLTTSWEKRSERKGTKGKIYLFSKNDIPKNDTETYKWMSFQRVTQRHTKAFLRDHCKELEKNNRMERLEIS